MVDVSEKLEQGYIRTKMLVELVGKPKEHVEATLKQYLEHIKKNKDIDILEADMGEAKELEDNKGFFVSFIEIEMLARNIPTMIAFCFDYMPSSIEIIEPKELKMKDKEITDIMNDLQGKLHKMDMAAKQINSENQILKKNIYFMATNLVANLMKMGVKNLKDLTRLSGMDEKGMKEFLEKLIKQKFVAKEGEEYKWIKQ